ncbi:MAG: hypothetical protein M0C28_33355 [Candidatus Moduliflexus flocculans]|nr:hypothetical protein [Candidatus Moduliflexus flocculans]
MKDRISVIKDIFGAKVWLSVTLTIFDEFHSKFLGEEGSYESRREAGFARGFTLGKERARCLFGGGV